MPGHQKGVRVRPGCPVSVSSRMSIAEVAAALGVTRTTALKLVRAGTVPGGRRLYAYEGRRGERWDVETAMFERWRGIPRH